MRRSHTSLLFITLAVLAILLGHDTVMAMNPHAQVDGVHHQNVVQECGPDHHSASQTPLPLLPVSIAPALPAIPVTVAFAVDAGATDQFLVSADPSLLRALLQVFLI